MKKYTQKWLSFLSVIILVMLVLVACGNGNTNKKNDFGDLYEAISQYREMLASEDTSSDEASDVIAKELKYVLVIPARCGADIFDSAAFLSSELSKYVASEVEVVYDRDLKSYSDKIEILIGDTDRAESRRFLKGLRKDDYGYRYDNGVIVVGAYRESCCVTGIYAFAADIESGKVDLSHPEDIQESIVAGQYSITSIKLNGFELCEYDIVYPAANKLSEKALAERLRDDIAEYSGYYLRVISEKECTDATRAICVGQSLMTSDYSSCLGAYVSVNTDGHIELVSNDNFGIHKAVGNFLDMIKESESQGACTLELSGTKQYLYSNDTFSLYIVRNNFNSATLEGYLAAIRGAGVASAAIFDRTSEDARHNLTSNLQNTYSIGELLACYNSDNFECVSSKNNMLASGAGVITIVMKRSDGILFGVVCGLCEDGTAAADDEAFYDVLVKDCQGLGDMPVVVIHELGSTLYEKFAEDNPSLLPLANAKGIYYTSSYLKVKSYAVEEIASSTFADKLDFEIYYS